jgi:hypothetical protein
MKIAEDIEIYRLCEQSGYGYVMQMACRMWGKKDKNEGGHGGEHTIGPCRARMKPCPCESPVNCDWCEGCGLVTLKVHDLVLAEIEKNKPQAKPCLHTHGCRGISNCSCENCREFHEKR